MRFEMTKKYCIIGENIHVLTANYDASIAAGSLMWNLGQNEAYKQMMELVDWEISEASLHKLKKQCNKLDIKKTKKMAAKPAIIANRRAHQAQWHDKSQYRTSLLQAQDHARQTAPT